MDLNEPFTHRHRRVCKLSVPPIRKCRRSPFKWSGRLRRYQALGDQRRSSQSSRIPPSCAREETPESRGMPCLFLNTERGFGGKPPKKSGFRRHLAGSKMPKEGSKMPKETFFTAISRWRVVSRPLVSDRDDAALFPAIRILERYGSAKSGRARRVRAGSLGK